MEKIKVYLTELFLKVGFSESISKNMTIFSLLLILIILLWVVRFLVREILIKVFVNISKKTKTNFDDILVEQRVPRKIASAVPLLIAFNIVPLIFKDTVIEESNIEKILSAAGIIVFLIIIQALLSTIKGFLKTKQNFKDKPIDSYAQVFSFIIWIVGLFSVFATLTGIPFFKFITTLGAASAVLLLIFKDTILGFVASIQVSINDMVRIGDWITFPKYGADGDVIEINVTTVKVRNFDLTITTIPTYSLISDSFKNWRGMEESRGRRIKRAIHIKQNSVKYLTTDEVDKLKKITHLTSYLEGRQESIEKYNQENSIAKDVLLNGRNLTNIGVFRKYVDEYLKSHSGINKDLLIMVRQLAPTTQGIPIEIYAFTTDKRWENYEYIMADIFDHILPALPYFELELFELPSNTNLSVE